jgi:C1A family cysteine protease
MAMTDDSAGAAPDTPAAPTARNISRYGWVPDLPDARDRIYAAPRPTAAALPAMVDLTSQFGPVYDQGQLGSCTGNALAGAFEYDLRKQELPDFIPSRLFIYYNERRIEGTVHSDSGAQIRDGVKTLVRQGVCPETSWPYDIDKFANKPTASCYTDALTHQATSYQRVPQVISELKGCLAEGYPFVFGFTVYQSFESEDVAKTGIVPMPSPSESVLGGHAVVAVGYDDSDERFRVRNSWGTGWGQEGYFTMPYAYLTNTGLAADFWTLRLVEG